MPVERLDSAISQEHFYAFLEQEMRKIEQFTKKQVWISIFEDVQISKILCI